MKFIPRETVEEFFDVLDGCIGRPEMASSDLFVDLWVYFGVAFYSFWVFSFRNSLIWVLHFFLCQYSFFYVLVMINSTVFSRCIFCCCGSGLDVLLFLSLFLCSFVRIRAVSTGYGKCLVLHIFSTLFLFFLFVFFCSFYCLFWAYFQVWSQTFERLVTMIYVRFCRSVLFAFLLRSIRPNCVVWVRHRWRCSRVYPPDSHTSFLQVCSVLSCPVPVPNHNPWSSLLRFRSPILNYVSLNPSAPIDTHNGHPPTTPTHSYWHPIFDIFTVFD